MIVAPVGQRGQELVQQISVRPVKLDGIEPKAGGALRRRGESVADPDEPCGIERQRRILMRRERFR